MIHDFCKIIKPKTVKKAYYTMYNRCMICLFSIGLQGLLSPESPVGPEDDKGGRGYTK